MGEDSPTQQGAFDLSFLRCIPGIVLLAPRDDVDLDVMLRWALKQDGPVALRYARSAAPTIGSPENRHPNPRPDTAPRRRRHPVGDRPRVGPLALKRPKHSNQSGFPYASPMRAA